MNLRRVIGGFILTGTLGLSGLAQSVETNLPPADDWFTNSFRWPDFVSTQPVAAAFFEHLQAREAGARIKVYWTPLNMDTNATVDVFTSTDAPDHWPMRDWKHGTAVNNGSNWTANLPVEDPDMPVAYFLRNSNTGQTNISPLRMAFPRRLGIEEPTRLFWPYLEGFETGMESWRLAAADTGSLALTTESRTGLAALLVTLPPGKRSVTVGTTHVRSWVATKHGIRGLGLWIRTRSGEITVRSSLHAHAFSTNHVFSISTLEPRVDDQWQRLDIDFSSFPKPSLAEVDWFTLEFIADGPRDILLDDLQYLGPWKPE